MQKGRQTQKICFFFVEVPTSPRPQQFIFFFSFVSSFFPFLGFSNSPGSGVLTLPPICGLATNRGWGDGVCSLKKAKYMYHVLLNAKLNYYFLIFFFLFLFIYMYVFIFYFVLPYYNDKLANTYVLFYHNLTCNNMYNNISLLQYMNDSVFMNIIHLYQR